MKKFNIFPLWFLCFVWVCIGQTDTQNSKNTADQTLRSAARVNPSTLGMEFNLPIGRYRGRGFDVPLGLSYSSKLWRFEEVYRHQPICDDPDDPGCPAPARVYTEGIYSEDSISGWSNQTARPYIEYTGRKYIFDAHGMLIPQGSGSYPASPLPLKYVRRITVFLPGGESHEMRADDAPVAVPAGGGTPPPEEWEGIFFATDGSGLRYEQDVNDGLFRLYFPDGSFYDFAPDPYETILRFGIKLTDANGNYMEYVEPDTQEIYDPYGSWRDQLGRLFPIMVPSHSSHTEWWGDPEVTEKTEEFELPGMENARYTLIWKRLQNAFGGSYVLHYIGGMQSYPGTTPVYSPTLFGSGGPMSNECGSGASNLYVLDDRITQIATKFNPMVLAEIELPNGASYRFKYNTYGEIERIEYPTGGRETFEYAQMPTLAHQASGFQQTNRGVSVHRIYHDDSDSSPIISEYAADTSPTSPTIYRTTVVNPDGTRTENYMHRGLPPRCYITDELNLFGTHWAYDLVLAGRTFETRTFASGQSPPIMQRTITRWGKTDNTNVTMVYQPTPIYVQNNARMISTETVTYSGSVGVSSVTELEYADENAYGSPLNVTLKKEYGYLKVTNGGSFNLGASLSTVVVPTASPTPGALVRQTETAYKTGSAYETRNLLRLPIQILIKDGASSANIVAKTQIDYDQFGLLDDAKGATVAGWDDPGSTTVRGLPTSTKTWYDPMNGSAFVETQTQYNFFGSPRLARDGNGNWSEVKYEDNFGESPAIATFAFPTTTISALPGGNGSSNSFISTTIYDFETGLPVSSTDINGQTTTMEYQDPLRRPTRVVSPNGHQTITEYGTPSGGQYPTEEKFVKIKSQIDSSSWKESYTWHDGLGRPERTQSVDDDGDVFVLTCYDNAGRVSKVTNPFRNWTSARTCEETPSPLEWTINSFDTAGRPWQVTTPDGASVETLYGVSNSGNIGTVVTVKDQALKERRSITNALGHLMRVDEPTSGGLGTTAEPTQPTLYTYDLLNNLLTVTQNGSGIEQCGPSGGSCFQPRTFTYDALSRLKTATNPESGTIKYTYDNNGNLKTKWDGRGIKTIYDYDALNRVWKRCHRLVGTSSLGNTTCATASAETPEPNTPDVAYHYDNLANAKGKLIKVTNGDGEGRSTTEYTSFDILGRVTGHKQTTDGHEYTTAYTYNLAGSLIEQTYPSTRIVKNILDNDGDLSIVQSKKTSSAGYWNYADSFKYNAAGAVTSMQLGNGRWESTVFNARLQPEKIGLGATPGSTNLLALDYEYGRLNPGNGQTIEGTNNGNLSKQKITVPSVGTTSGFIAQQFYTYDSVNRLKEASETLTPTGGSNQYWYQVFEYDRYGNRRFNDLQTTTLGSCPTAVCNPSINPNNNKLTSNGWAYDNTGNTTIDASNRTFTYDGENKQVKVKNGSNVTLGEYWYDGDGKRVKKKGYNSTGDLVEHTIFVYDATGKLIGEYATEIADSEDAEVGYLTADHLGSPRINTDRDGNVTSRHDYHPFGEEIGTLNGGSQGRAGHSDYGSDSVRNQFTGKERDLESKLDYFAARYYSSMLGRFVSPDEFSGGPDDLFGFADLAAENPTFYADLDNPQSLNKYQYVYNSPYRYLDLDGHEASEATFDCPPNCPAQITMPMPWWIELTLPRVGPTTIDVIVLPNGSTYRGKTFTDEIGNIVDESGNILRPASKVSPRPLPRAAEGQAQPQARPTPTRMAKGNRNVGKVNQNRKTAATQRIESLRKELNGLRSKPNKTPADKKKISELERKIKKEQTRTRESEEHAKRKRGT